MEFMSYHFSNEYPELKKKLPLQKIIFDCHHLISALKFDPPPTQEVLYM